MRATKENIIEYLTEIKPALLNDGIITLALFGSFATNKENAYSDIDIAIAKKENFLKENSSYSYFDIVNDIKSKIQRKFHRNIDIFDLDSNSPLKNSIKKDLLYV